MPDYEESQQFASRYSDPNHPASNGSLISLLTGGHVNPKAGVDNLRQKYQDRKREKANAEIATAGGTEVLPQTRVMNREGVLARVLRQVLAPKSSFPLCFLSIQVLHEMQG